MIFHYDVNCGHTTLHHYRNIVKELREQFLLKRKSLFLIEHKSEAWIQFSQAKLRFFDRTHLREVKVRFEFRSKLLGLRVIINESIENIIPKCLIRKSPDLFFCDASLSSKLWVPWKKKSLILKSG